ncbi:hypothetical protein ABEB36_000642 [Hypothenemus hampei]|uniref:Odorant receptor n=1 Tax=Hypothenemus hampei TaxID=57062 RepID=A0ABD1FBY3_HYPHA
MPNINDMEHELRKIINSVTFKVELIVLCLGACTLITTIMYVYDVFFYEDRLLLQLFFRKDSILYQMVRITMCCIVVFSCFITIASPMHFIVFLFYSQIQVFQLLDKIKRFDRKMSNENVDEQSVLENLKIFGQRYLDIKSFHYEALEVSHLYLTTYSITGLTVGISSLIAMFFYNAPQGPALINFFVYISFVYGLTAVVQEYEDTQKHLSRALYDLRWYLWDAKCQKFHLLLMSQMAEELKIPILFVIYADFELFKKIGSIMYPVGKNIHL